MRLLQYTETGEFSLTGDMFDKDQIPPYAILSHTWGLDTEEVTFKDMIGGTANDKPGYEKIRFCGQRARQDGLQFFWIDSCCIDRSSSNEVSETINSMFRWYHDAAKCYVYLSDVPACTSTEDSQPYNEKLEFAFQHSRWFTRGWTLQELLAPASVEFFSLDGQRLGDKNSLQQKIHEITGIALQALQGSPLSLFSVSDRMSWAAKRQTKREEDAAYSLLGIFDTHMPPMYGEGREKALIRLYNAVKESLKDNLLAVPPALSSKHGDAFKIQEVLTELGDGIWILRTDPIYWKIVIDYTPLGREKVFESAIVDLPWFVNGDPMAEERDTAYIKFLNQFGNIHVRWGYHYERLTENIISWTAGYQKDLLQLKNGGLRGANEDTLVLLALRCLVISYDIALIGCYFPSRHFLDKDSSFKYLELNKAELEEPLRKNPGDGQTLVPSIELWQLPEDYELPNDRKKEIDSVHCLLPKTFQTASMVLLRGRPQDWPALFYTLCLLMMTYQSFGFMDLYTHALDTFSRRYRKALKSLIELFLFHCGNLHPLNADLNIGWFSLIVGGENLPIKHYTKMNRIWVENRSDSDVVKNAEDFFKHLDNFCTAFTLCAITAANKAVDMMPLDDPDRYNVLNALANCQGMQYNESGKVEDLDRAIETTRSALKSAPLNGRNRAKTHNTLAIQLRARIGVDRRTAIKNFDEAIDVAKTAVTSTPVDHPERAALWSHFGDLLILRRKETGAWVDFLSALGAYMEGWMCVNAPPSTRIKLATKAAVILGSENEWERSYQHLQQALGFLPQLSPRSLKNTDKQYTQSPEYCP